VLTALISVLTFRYDKIIIGIKPERDRGRFTVF
jgi:hypothetical protein